ncbi:MAG: DUF2946 family protein [Stellaceae bacterium]
MITRKRQSLRWAARAGILALALNALVPIHLAFDLAEALTPSHHGASVPENHGLEWRVLATLIGHNAHDADDGDGDADHGHHHDATCPVIAAFGALTGLITAAAPVLAQPLAVAVADLPAPMAERSIFALAVAYRSRAPPRV